MPRKIGRTSAKATEKKADSSLEVEVQSALRWLKRHATKRTLEGMARYGLPSDNALGVSVADIRCWPSSSGGITSLPPHFGRRAYTRLVC